MAYKTKAQLKTEKNTFTDGGGNTASMFRDEQESIIDSLNMSYNSAIDCSTNPNYPAADKGMMFRVSAAGKIGGASGTYVNAGDIIFCHTDSAGGSEAGFGANYQVIHVMNSYSKKAVAESDYFRYFSASCIMIQSPVIDLLATATDIEITIPSGFHFFLTECGMIIVNPASAIADPPTIRFGEGAGSEASLIAAVAITGTNAVNERKRFTTFVKDDGVTKLSCGVTVAGTGSAYNGRAYFIGMLIQDQPAS